MLIDGTACHAYEKMHFALCPILEKTGNPLFHYWVKVRHNAQKLFTLLPILPPLMMTANIIKFWTLHTQVRSSILYHLSGETLSPDDLYARPFLRSYWDGYLLFGDRRVGYWQYILSPIHFAPHILYCTKHLTVASNIRLFYLALVTLLPH